MTSEQTVNPGPETGTIKVCVFPVALREPLAVKGTLRIGVDRLFVVWFHVNMLICLKCKIHSSHLRFKAGGSC